MTLETGTEDPARTRAPGGPGGRAPRRHGFVFYLGLVMVLAGLGMLGYVGWQYLGTNVVSHQKQHRLVTDLQQSWRSDAGAGGSSQGRLHAGTTPLGDAEALIRIPRFGADYVMPVLHGVDDGALASGFGHFPHTADPGEKGNYALAAHRVTHGEPLHDMPRLRPGDKVVVETRDAVYTYRLDTDPNALVVGFHDVWVIDRHPVNPDPDGVQPPSSRRLITLTTCAELFHTDERMIAFGHLVRTVPKS